jgi:helix-turn-helix protein
VTTLRRWSGAEARALREAKRMSIREFAAHLGVSDRMISKWEAGADRIQPRPVNQAALNTSLAQSSGSRFSSPARRHRRQLSNRTGTQRPQRTTRSGIRSTVSSWPWSTPESFSTVQTTNPSGCPLSTSTCTQPPRKRRRRHHSQRQIPQRRQPLRRLRPVRKRLGVVRHRDRSLPTRTQRQRLH